LDGEGGQNLFFAGLLSIIGILFHPTFLLLYCCLFLYLLYGFLKSKDKRGFFKNPQGILLAFFLLFGAVGVLYAVFFLRQWVEISTGGAGGWGYSSVFFILQIAKYWGFPVFFLGFFGLVLLFRSKKYHSLPVFLILIFITPIAVLFALSFFVDVRPDYVMVSLPAAFIGSGFFLSCFFEFKGFPKIYAIVISLVIYLFMIPGFASYYVGRGSLDIRDAVYFLENNISNNDFIVSFEGEFNYYWNDKSLIEPFPGTKDSYMTLRNIEKYEAFNGKDGWIVMVESRAGIADNLKNWLLSKTSLVFEKGEVRYDYTYRMIRIYKIN
jgi:hypothetical protein